MKRNRNKNFAGIYRDEVCKLSGATRSVLLNLLVLCNHTSNPDFIFDNCPFPLGRGDLITSWGELSKACGFSVQSTRTVCGKLKKLKILTWSSTGILTNRAIKISVIAIDKFLHSNIELTDPLTDPLTDRQQTPNRPLTTNKNDKEEKEIKENNKKTNFDILFDEFWDLYPEKKSKKKAKEKYSKIYKHHAEIIAGLKKYVDYCQFIKKKQKEDPKGNHFLPNHKHPTTWLNQECWRDEFSAEYERNASRITANESFRRHEAQEKAKKDASISLERFRRVFFDQKFGAGNWTIFKIGKGDAVGMKTCISDHPELAAEVIYAFRKQHPNEFALLFPQEVKNS